MGQKEPMKNQMNASLKAFYTVRLIAAGLVFLVVFAGSPVYGDEAPECNDNSKCRNHYVHGGSLLIDIEVTSV
jgi:hypothetical protein